MYCTKCKIKFPDQITKHSCKSITEQPENYEGFVYKIVVLKTSVKTEATIYVGSHGSEKHEIKVGDGYWHSSTCDIFQEIYTNSSSELFYEVLNYQDDYKITLNVEAKMLTEVNAKDNDNYFNKHNGSSAINNDVEYAENLGKRIRAGEFRQDKKEPLDKLDSLFHYQGRFKDILEQQTYVTQQLNDSMGVTDKCQPVTILENRLRNGIKEDVRIDGQQTIQGAKNCKYAKLTDRTLDLSVSRVPESVHCHLEDDAITGLANLLNCPVNQIRDTYFDEKWDAQKFLVDNYNLYNKPVKSIRNTEWLNAYGMSDYHKTKARKNAIDEIAKQKEKIKTGQTFVDWDLLENVDELAKRVTERISESTICFSYSSGNFKSLTHKIFTTVLKEEDRIEKLNKKDRPESKKNIDILIVHPGPTTKRTWDKTNLPRIEKMLDFYVRPHGYDPQFIYQEMFVPNTL